LFVVATSASQDLQILDAAVPLGTAAHYGFLKQMSHFGVDIPSMKIADMDPTDGAAAIAQGSIDNVH